ncbi:RusA family crossover junction endodeoxyribonuclease [Atopobiaceae bacterium HCP3S3_F7]|uniref:RusA family crossover junction endodeoxyribonuclease n=1 Tax=Coriobacteriia TaxID=84998 RepID=UPI003F8CA5D9
MWSVTVYGDPQTKGSLKCVGRHGRHQLIEDDKTGKKKWWRARVAAAARAIAQRSGTLTGPIGVRCILTIARPKSARLDADPITRSSGDIDKLSRMILDALTDAGLWTDDSQCVDLRARKLYVGHPDSATQPGCHLTIWQATILGGL